MVPTSHQRVTWMCAWHGCAAHHQHPPPGQSGLYDGCHGGGRNRGGVAGWEGQGLGDVAQGPCGQHRSLECVPYTVDMLLLLLLVMVVLFLSTAGPPVSSCSAPNSQGRGMCATHLGVITTSASCHARLSRVRVAWRTQLTPGQHCAGCQQQQRCAETMLLHTRRAFNGLSSRWKTPICELANTCITTRTTERS